MSYNNTINIRRGLPFIIRFALKLIYGVELEHTSPSNSWQRIPTDHSAQKHYLFTEKEYLKYLFSEGRSNISEQDLNIRYTQIYMIWGRLAGKSLLASEILKTDLKILVENSNVQNYLESNPTINLDLIHSSPSLSLSRITRRLIDQTYHPDRHIRYYPSEIRFCSNTQKLKSIPRHDVKLSFKQFYQPQSGRVFVTELLEEVSSSKDRVYFSGILPNTNNSSERSLNEKRVAISTPQRKERFFTEDFLRRIVSREDTLILRIPTWEAREDLSSAFYKEQYSIDPIRFNIEYGAELLY